MQAASRTLRLAQSGINNTRSPAAGVNHANFLVFGRKASFTWAITLFHSSKSRRRR